MTIPRRWRDRSRVHRWLSDLRTRLSLRPSTRAAWRARWGDASYETPWAGATVPDPVQAALASGWLKAGDSVLDVGCGDGKIAAFLADAGCTVTAIDFAEGAVARTRERCQRFGDRVHVELCDITSGLPSRAGFDAVVDVGCFQSLVPRFAARYARNVATVCRPGAHVTLVLPISCLWRAPVEKAYAERLRRNVFRVFSPAFTVVDAQEAPFRAAAGDAASHSGVSLAVRLERR